MLIDSRPKVQMNVKSIFERKIDVESFALRIKMAERENVIRASDKSVNRRQHVYGAHTNKRIAGELCGLFCFRRIIAVSFQTREKISEHISSRR